MYRLTICVLLLGVSALNQAAPLEKNDVPSEGLVVPSTSLNNPVANVGKYLYITGPHFPCPEPENISPCTCSYDGKGFLILDCSKVTSNEELGHSLFGGDAYFPYNEISLFRIMNNNNITQLEDITRNIHCKSVDLQIPTLKQISQNFLLQSFTTLETWTIKEGLLFNPEFPFSNLKSMTKLRSLAVEYNYLLHHLPVISSSSLQHFDFSNNGLTTLANFVFSYAPLLRFVTLQNNHISSLPTHTIDIRRPRDTYTYLFTSNQISFIDPAAFYVHIVDNHTTVVVQLSYNKLTSLDSRVFGPLVDRTGPRTRIYAEHNPFTCDCSVAWLFQQSIHNTSYFAAIADEPTCEDGTKLHDLKMADYMHCFKVQEELIS